MADFIEDLIDVLKQLMDNIFIIPYSGAKSKHEAKSKVNFRDTFELSVYRGDKNINKYSLNCLYKNTNTLIFRIDVGEHLAHTNPDGTIIHGSHIHYFVDGYDISYAYSFDFSKMETVDVAKDFLRRINIENYDKIKIQDKERTLFTNPHESN